MGAVYTLTIMTHFSASHVIPGHPGKCQRLHGHNWNVEVSVEAHELDHLGMGLDFFIIKQAAHTSVESLDHQHLNDLPYFQTCPPTAENIAAWLYHEISKQINTAAVRVVAVKVWETERCAVEYRFKEDLHAIS